jgi:deoxyribodipyrimidine photo-lyase
MTMHADTAQRWETAIVWFRHDLRLADHPALVDAVSSARSVVPLFVLDDRLAATSPARTWFMHRSLERLAASLQARGSGLVVRDGPAEAVVADVAREVGAEVVLATRDVTPLSHRRDRAVAAALERDGRRLLLRPGLLLAEPDQMLTSKGTAYGVFTPFWRVLQRTPRRQLLAAPTRIESPAVANVGTTLHIPDAPLPGLPEPGEAAAHERLQAWVAGGLTAYGNERDELSGSSTSHLGADLHFGLLSPLQVELAASEAGEDATAFVRQIAWREFYHHQLFARRAADPGAAHPLLSAFRSEDEDPDAVTAWREGRTGIPVVDAAMRQLSQTGWMSNRARLVVASFLTRHLLMDYRIGERHFLRHLIDGDVANNRGGWQWTAGVGADAQPWFRIFNPVRQGLRFDPEGEWVRRWVPELADVPPRYVHAPWEMPADVAAQAGLRLGQTYPRPIVDLAVGRERALGAFRAATGRD